MKKKIISIVLIMIVVAMNVFSFATTAILEQLKKDYTYVVKMTRESDGAYFYFASNTPFIANNDTTITTFKNTSVVKYYVIQASGTVESTNTFTSSSIMDGHAPYKVDFTSHDLSTDSGKVVFRKPHWTQNQAVETMGVQMIIPAVMVTITVVLVFLAFRKSWKVLRNLLRMA